MQPSPIVRPSARVILIGPGARTLLFRGGDPHRPEAGTWWFTPGGGLEAGESSAEAARRELYEETGQSTVVWSDVVARRRAIFDFCGATYESIEDFYVAHTSDLDVSRAGFSDIEVESVAEHRWLDATSIRRLTEPVHPTELATVVSGLARARYPIEPWNWSD